MTKSHRPDQQNPKRGFWLFALPSCVILILQLVACRPAALFEPTPTATTSPTASPSSTSTPFPTNTSTPVSSPTSTATPTSAPSSTSTSAARISFDGGRAYQLVIDQTEFGYRPTGSEAGWATGDWIIERLSEAGWQIETQEFEYRGVRCRNVIGKMAANAELPIVVLGAHYDTRRRADRDAERPTEPVMGANDGASGTAVLLELARTLESDRVPYQVWLVFFDAEDNGRLDGWDWIVGSTYFAWQVAERPEFVVIVDMVGDSDQQIYYEQNSDPALMQAIWEAAADLGYDDTIVPEYRHSMLDDHTPFLRLGIPAVDIIDFDYPYWHTTADTVDKVSEESLERVGRTLEAFLESAAPGSLP